MTWHYAGMTVREYFVATALAGLLANPMNSRENLTLLTGLAWQAADAALEGVDE